MITKNDLVTCSSVLEHNLNLSELSDIIITTDSRHLSQANTFIALYGDNFSGNDFVEQVILKGITIVVYCEKQSDKTFNTESYPGISFIKVDDTLDYILELGEVISCKWQKNGGLMIGLTGSNGKTTNKEILYSLLNNIFPEEVHKTEGNLNNNIGVPLTLFKLKKEHKICIVEMGMNHRGEIAPLAKCTRPQVGLITSIGPAHLEYLKTIENIFLEKKELYDWIEKNAGEKKLFVVRDNDEYLRKIPKSSWCHHLDNSFYINESKSFSLNFLDKSYKIKNRNLFGSHHQDNLAQCLYLCLKLFPQRKEDLVSATEEFIMPEMNRGVTYNRNGVFVFLDAYNANPASMAVSIDSFNLYCDEKNIAMSQRLYILGDMNELGDHSTKMHQDLSRYLEQTGACHAYFVGRYAGDYQSAFKKKSLTFQVTSQVSKHYEKALKTYKAIFIKGSRSLQLESILDINE